MDTKRYYYRYVPDPGTADTGTLHLGLDNYSPYANRNGKINFDYEAYNNRDPRGIVGYSIEDLRALLSKLRVGKPHQPEIERVSHVCLYLTDTNLNALGELASRQNIWKPDERLVADKWIVFVNTASRSIPDFSKPKGENPWEYLVILLDKAGSKSVTVRMMPPPAQPLQPERASAAAKTTDSDAESDSSPDRYSSSRVGRRRSAGSSVSPTIQNRAPELVEYDWQRFWFGFFQKLGSKLVEVRAQASLSVVSFWLAAALSNNTVPDLVNLTSLEMSTDDYARQAAWRSDVETEEWPVLKCLYRYRNQLSTLSLYGSEVDYLQDRIMKVPPNSNLTASSVIATMPTLRTLKFGFSFSAVEERTRNLSAVLNVIFSRTKSIEAFEYIFTSVPSPLDPWFLQQPPATIELQRRSQRVADKLVRDRFMCRYIIGDVVNAVKSSAADGRGGAFSLRIITLRGFDTNLKGSDQYQREFNDAPSLIPTGKPGWPRQIRFEIAHSTSLSRSVSPVPFAPASPGPRTLASDPPKNVNITPEPPAARPAEPPSPPRLIPRRLGTPQEPAYQPKPEELPPMSPWTEGGGGGLGRLSQSSDGPLWYGEQNLLSFSQESNASSTFVHEFVKRSRGGSTSSIGNIGVQVTPGLPHPEGIQDPLTKVESNPQPLDPSSQDVLVNNSQGSEFSMTSWGLWGMPPSTLHLFPDVEYSQ